MRGQYRRVFAAFVFNAAFAASANLLSFVSLAQPPQTTFRDDFAGASLRPEWNIIDPDPNRWELVDGDFLVLVLKGEKNKFCYIGQLQDSYEFILNLLLTDDIDIRDSFYISFDDEKNDGIKLLLSHGLALMKTLGEDKSKIYVPTSNVPGAGLRYYMKIRKSGIEYVGYMSRDGSRWTEVGKYYFPKFSGIPCFGGASVSRSEKAVKVDFVELKPLR